MGLASDLQLLYPPDTVSLMIRAVTTGLHDMDARQVKATQAEAVGKVAPAVVTLLFAVAAVQIMLQSGNAAGTDNMLIILSEGTAGIAGGVCLFFAAFVDAFGAFLAGSNTVSNILFDTLQYGAADQVDTPKTVMLGAQTVGEAIGSLIAVHNVVVVLAVVDLVGEEGHVIHFELVPPLYYGTATGVLAFLFDCTLFPGVSQPVGSRLGTI